MTEWILGILFVIGECSWELLKIGLTVAAAWLAYLEYKFGKDSMISS